MNANTVSKANVCRFEEKINNNIRKLTISEVYESNEIDEKEKRNIALLINEKVSVNTRSGMVIGEHFHPHDPDEELVYIGKKAELELVRSSSEWSLAKEFAQQKVMEGWRYRLDNINKPYLWNMTSNALTSLEGMKIKAAKHGVKDMDIAAWSIRKFIPDIDGIRWIPNGPEIISVNGCNFLNTFKKMADTEDEDENSWLEHFEGMELDKYDVSPFLELMERLSPDDQAKQWLVCWIAHMLQKPEERPSVHPLIRSVQGVGKNVLVERVLNKLLLGQVVVSSAKQIRGAYSEDLANNLLVMVDEIKSKGMDFYLSMKSILTTTQATINPKYERPYQQEIFARFLFCDNTEGVAFRIEEEDRRLAIFDYTPHELDLDESREFIKGFLEWFNAYWMDVHHYLMNLDISEWDAHTAPDTEAKRDYVGICRDSLTRYIEQYAVETGRRTITEASWDSFIVMATGVVDSEYTWQRLAKKEDFKYRLTDRGYRFGQWNKRTGEVRERVRAWILGDEKGAVAYDLVMSEASPSVSQEIEGHGYTI